MLFSLTGQVKDIMTLLPLESSTVMLIGENGDTAVTLTDTRGMYRFDTTMVREYSSYDLIFRKDNYFSKKDAISTRPYRDDHQFRVDVALEPIPEKPIVLPDILYALDDWRLQPQYEDSLMQLVRLLRDNENLVIELRSHTDSRASYEYNDTLSQKRAQSVVDFLISQGIEPGRLVARGYGERIFRVLNKDITREGYTFRQGTEINDPFVNALPTKEIREAAYQLNRRTEFAVLRKDYKAGPAAAGAAATQIQIISDTTARLIAYDLSDDGLVRVTLYLNDYGIPAVFDSKGTPSLSQGTPSLESDSLLMTAAVAIPVQGTPSLSQGTPSLIGQNLVLDFLKKGAINRNNFPGDFDTIMAGDTLAEGSTVIFAKARLGHIVLDPLELKISRKAGDRVIIGRDMMDRIGTFTIDENKKQLIFR
jgi:peptidoglycan-associated lipoprotein